MKFAVTGVFVLLGGGGGRGVHTCDKFQRGIREVFLSFPGGF